MPTIRKIAPPDAAQSAPAKRNGMPADGDQGALKQQIAAIVQYGDAAGLLDQALASLRALGYEIRPHGLHWRVQFADAPQPTVLTSPELLALAGGLDAALAAQIAARAASVAAGPVAAGPPAPAPTEGAPLLVDLDAIDDNPYQPRLTYDAERIAAIAASIQAHGLLQTPLARQAGDGRYQLAFGHSRLRAYRQLAASDAQRFGRMRLMVRPLDDETMALHAWIENRDRKDLTPYEEARAIERFTAAFGWTQKAAAAKLQLTQPTIANKLRLLKLPEAVLAQLRDGAISERQAAALLPLVELPDAVAAATRRIWLGPDVGEISGVADLYAKAPKLDSNRLRQAVEAILRELTIPLGSLPWRNEMWAVAGVRAARCADCPIRLASSDRCPDKACANIKASAWRVQQADAACVAAGLPSTTYRNYADRDDLSGVQLDAIRAVATEKGCGHLAVVYDDDLAYYPHPVADHKNCFIVCGHGPGKRCGCKQALARRADPATSEDARKRHERARIKQELFGPAKAAVAAALAQPTPAVWRALLGRAHSGAERKLPADADTPAILAALADALAADALGYYQEYPDYGGARRGLERLLRGFGAPIPWADDHLRANTPDTAGDAPAPDPAADSDAPDQAADADAAPDPLAPVRRQVGLLTPLLQEPDLRDDEARALADQRARLAGELAGLVDADGVSDESYEDLATQIGAAQRQVAERLAVASEVGA